MDVSFLSLCWNLQRHRCSGVGAGGALMLESPNLFAFGNAKCFAFRDGIIARHACGFAAFTAELQGNRILFNRRGTFLGSGGAQGKQKLEQQHGPNHRREGSTVLWNCWNSIDSYWSRKWLRKFHQIHIETVAICSSRCPPISSHVRSWMLPKRIQKPRSSFPVGKNILSTWKISATQYWWWHLRHRALKHRRWRNEKAKVNNEAKHRPFNWW